MTSPEYNHGKPEKEPPQPTYYRAARFAEDTESSRAYGRVERTLYQNRQLDLSVFRVILDAQWLLVILGTPPPEPFEERLQQLLLPGEPVALRPEVLSILQRRRHDSRGLGGWVERHYRPGKRL